MKKQTTTIWQFPGISPIKQREGFYCKESMSHPAKMPTYLAQSIILTYTQKGDFILDPMTGIGTTVIEAVKLGRNAVGVEYEKKFMNLCNKNLRLTREKMNNSIGKGMFIQGDSRDLGKVLRSSNNFDSIIFSPPFADSLAGSSKDNIKKFRHGSAGKDYGDRRDANQIGNLKHTPIDTIIFSPPYEQVVCNQDNNSELCRRKFGYMVPYSDKPREKMQPSQINIGLQKGKTYLGEMLKVYQECYSVLKHGSLMILVVKNFRRKGEEADLMGDTIQLCRMAGFQFFQTCIRVLNGVSFWQINNTRKTPHLMLNITEYILVFKKGLRKGDSPWTY